MPTKAQAKKLTKLILRENKKGLSYRNIARLSKVKDKDGKLILKAGTLNRFAKAKGEWMPKDQEILKALGLQHEPRTKRIFDMSPRELLWRLTNRENIQ